MSSQPPSPPPDSLTVHARMQPETPEEAAYVVENCDAVLIWVDAEYTQLFPQTGERVRHVLAYGGAPADRSGILDGDGIVEKASAEEPEVDRSHLSPATMIYTSGT